MGNAMNEEIYEQGIQLGIPISGNVSEERMVRRIMNAINKECYEWRYMTKQWKTLCSTPEKWNEMKNETNKIRIHGTWRRDTRTSMEEICDEKGMHCPTKYMCQ